MYGYLLWYDNNETLAKVDASFCLADLPLMVNPWGIPAVSSRPYLQISVLCPPFVPSSFS